MSTERSVVVAAAIDDRFAIPLLVTLRSAAKNLSRGWQLDVFVIGYKLHESSKATVQSGLADLPVRIFWETLDISHVREHWPGIDSDADLTIYSRLYLGETLPDSVDRVLYLDADLLVNGNLTELWASPFEGNILQAVPDAYAHLLHLPRLRRIEFSEAVSFEGRTPYFNAGVQLIDLQRWREEGVRAQVEAFLWKYGNRLFMREQDALNCCLPGRWKALAPTWNFHELPHLIGHWNGGALTPDELSRTSHDPKVVHFVGCKPWTGHCTHRYCEAWWSTAREVKVEEVRLPLCQRLWHRHVRLPHADLHWQLERGKSRTPESNPRRQLWGQLLRHPWMVVTYPLWSLVHKLRLGWMLLRAPRR